MGNMKIPKPKKGERRCQQTQCGYYVNGGCKACEECKASPYIINTSCQRCLKCENVPNELRFGDNKKKETLAETEEEINLLKITKAILDQRIKELESGKSDKPKEVVVMIPK